MFFYRPATRRDAEFLAPRLRDADALEVCDQYGTDDVAAILRACVDVERGAVAIEVDGVVAGLIGVQRTAPGRPELPQPSGCVWLVGSSALTASRVAFARESRATLRRMTAGLASVWNVVDPRYSAALTWLDWLGFQRTGRVVRAARGGTEYVEMLLVLDDPHGRTAGRSPSGVGRRRRGDEARRTGPAEGS